MPRARPNGELCTRFVQSLEAGEKDSFVPLVTSHEHVAEMWEVTFRYKVERDALVREAAPVLWHIARQTVRAGPAVCLRRGAPLLRKRALSSHDKGGG